MNITREKIINILNMDNILNKYGIKINNNKMFSCPFHKDISPSAKCYDKSFYCFSCGRSGDLIKFVQYLYNLNFQQGMDKIIDDFQLGFKTKGNYNKKQILEIQQQNEFKILKEKKEKEYFSKLCRRKDLYNNLANKWEKRIDLSNWEDMTLAISYLRDRAELLDIYICDKYNIES